MNAPSSTKNVSGIPDEEDALALKVMRLYKPRMREIEAQMGSSGFDTLSWTNGESGLLLLPESFGKIYIGQTFSCYISVCNTGIFEEMRNVRIRAELERSNSRIQLFDKREHEGTVSQYGFKSTVKVAEMVDMVVEQELANVGHHTLRVIVEFDSNLEPGTRKVLRKHYKFQVEKPLAFSCDFRRLPRKEDQPEKLAVQVSIRNTASVDLLLPQVDVLPLSENFVATAVESQNRIDIGIPVIIPPTHRRSFLFIIEPKPESKVTTLDLSPGMEIVRIVTRWRSDMAESGRLMSQPFVWTVDPDATEEAPTVDLALIIPTEPLVIKESADLQLCVTNNLDREIDVLLVYKDPESPVVICGDIKMDLGLLQPGQQKIEIIDVYPLLPGCFTLEHFKIIDKASSKVYSAKPLQIEVYGHEGKVPDIIQCFK